MFWIILIAMATIWFTLPDDHSQWPVLDDKPKKKETPMRKPPDVKCVGEYDCKKR